jgi:pimeloyl-ACP methyl ester carboxylesterase
VEVDDLAIHYVEAGDGEPVFLLLHGFGANAFEWRAVMDRLGQRGRVIAFDRPAFGLTERPMLEDWSGPNPYSTSSQVRLTTALMDRLEVEQAILVGNSAGGSLALQTYFEQPERVLALVLVDAAVFIPAGVPSWAKPLLQTPQMRRIGPLLVRSISLTGKSGFRLAWHDFSRVSSETIELHQKPQHADNWDRALWEYILASEAPKLTDYLDQVQAPTLVISGEEDRIVPAQQSVRLAEAIPGAEIALLPDCGHVPQGECPESFLDALLAFVETISP